MTTSEEDSETASEAASEDRPQQDSPGKTKKSLRRLFFTRTILFTLVPLTILAVVVQNQYKSTINKQIKDRLTVHVREIEALFAKERNEIENFLSFTTGDKSLSFYLSSLDVGQVRTALAEKISKFSVQQVKVYTYAGQPFLYYDGAFQSIHGQGVLPKEVIATLASRDDLNRVRFWKTGDDTILMLSEIRKIRGYQGKTVGYLEAFLPVGKKKVGDLKKSTGAEIVFFNRQGEVLLGSIPNPKESEMLSREFLLGHNTYIEFDLKSEPFAFISAKLSWGSKKFLLGVGSSTAEADRSLRRVNYVIVFTYLCFLVFFLIMSYFFVTEFIHPIEALIKASEQMKVSRDVVHIESESQTEIAELIDSFNDMSKLIYDSDYKLKNQLDLLEKANSKIKKTQGQLVQSAKLASLGELVAGIAHELNNPIGFIYSNVEHLKQYSQDLIALAEITDAKAVTAKKEEIDFDYIKKDFPKLIQSCEEGAVRAKEIVIGLRNFSRVDDEQVQQFDVNAGIESTLKLLGGELKNRIEVITQLGDLPLVRCNATQIKQVLMNILSNAAQAIDGKGKIAITTSALETGDAIGISIADSGPGISKENLEKIFDPFFTTKEVGKGTGLGLSISYGIITSHGGQIEVSSTEGKGTEFRIALPVVGVKALPQDGKPDLT